MWSTGRWRFGFGFSGDAGHDLRHGRWVRVCGDGAINVRDEATNTAVHPHQSEVDVAGTEIPQPRGLNGENIPEGAQMRPGDAAIENHAGQGRGQVAPGLIPTVPMDGASSGGVGGGTAQGVGRFAGSAEDDVTEGAIEKEMAFALVMLCGSDGDFSFGLYPSTGSG